LLIAQGLIDVLSVGWWRLLAEKLERVTCYATVSMIQFYGKSAASVAGSCLFTD